MPRKALSVPGVAQEAVCAPAAGIASDAVMTNAPIRREQICFIEASTGFARIIEAANRNRLYTPGIRLWEEMQKGLRAETNGDILVRNREAKWRSGPPFPCVCIVTQNPGTLPSFVWEWP